MKSSFNISEKSQRIISILSQKDSEVVKTSLSKVIPNSYALNNHLEELSKLELINIRKEKIVRNTFYISLTDKGRQVAEQLKNAELAAQGRLVKSFFSKPQPVLMFLGRVGRATVSQIKEEIPGSYEDLEELKKMNLISSDIDNVAYPPVNYIMLTEKGKKVCEEANKIAELVKN